MILLLSCLFAVYLHTYSTFDTTVCCPPPLPSIYWPNLYITIAMLLLHFESLSKKIHVCKPASQPASQPVSQSASQPVSQSVSQPVSQSFSVVSSMTVYCYLMCSICPLKRADHTVCPSVCLSGWLSGPLYIGEHMITLL